MTNRIEVTPAQRAEAVDLASRVGAAEAGRRLGINAATIRQWTKRQADAASNIVGRMSPHLATSTPGNRWVDRRPVVVDALGASVEEALIAARAAIGRSARDAKDYALMAAILIDKAQLLTGAATVRSEQRTEVRGVTLSVHQTGEELAAELDRMRAEFGIGQPTVGVGGGDGD